MGAKPLKKQKHQGLEKPDIYSYHDYREFLRAWFAYLSAHDKCFSIRKLARDAEISSGYLSMVVKGERKLTKKAMDKLRVHLQLNPSQFSYLECLSVLSDSDDQDERLRALKRMQRFGKYRKINIDEAQAYRYLSHWYYVAIREMADLKGMSFDTNQIRKLLRFKVDKKEVREAVQFLVDHDYVELRDNGEVALKERQIDCIGSVFKMGLTHFHKEMFQLAAKSIDQVDSEERAILGHTLAISESKVPELKQILQEAQNKVQELATDKSNHNVVYHTGFLAFPLTSLMGGEPGGMADEDTE